MRFGHRRDGRDRWIVPAIVALAIAPYVNAIPNSFVLDDTSIIAENPTIRDPANIGHLFATDYWGSTGRNAAVIDPGLYRPLTLTSYTLEYQLWGLDPRGYHLVNILLHALVSV